MDATLASEAAQQNVAAGRAAAADACCSVSEGGNEEIMTNEKYPPGWNEARVRRVLEYYESQSDEEAAAEIEAGLQRTTMEVPLVLVPVVRELIARRKSDRAHPTKTRNTALQSDERRASRTAKPKRGSRAARG